MNLNGASLTNSLGGSSLCREGNPQRTPGIDWIKLNRKIMESPTWSIPDSHLRLWIYFLLRSNIKERDWWDGSRRITIQRGEFVSSIQNMAKEARLTIGQIRGGIATLVALGNIIKKTTNQWTHIKVVNYSDYQALFTSSSSRNRPSTTNQQQTNNKPTTTTKEYKEYKEVKNLDLKEEIGKSKEERGGVKEGGVGETDAPPLLPAYEIKTQLQSVVLAYKLAKGFAREDAEWDRLYWKEAVPAAKELLGIFGGWRVAASCIEAVGEELSAKGLSWGLNAIVRQALEWRARGV